MLRFLEKTHCIRRQTEQANVSTRTMNMRQVAMMIPSLAESDEERVGLELVVVGGADEVGEG